MTAAIDLSALRTAADQADTAFDAVCKPHYADGRWGAYRAIECGYSVPSEVIAGLDAAHAARHAYYLARDGAGGFLGSRRI